jgi:hypothetical protein
MHVDMVGTEAELEEVEVAGLSVTTTWGGLADLLFIAGNLTGNIIDLHLFQPGRLAYIRWRP